MRTDLTYEGIATYNMMILNLNVTFVYMRTDLTYEGIATIDSVVILSADLKDMRTDLTYEGIATLSNLFH